MDYYNEDEFVNANTNTVNNQVTLELTVWRSKGLGLDLISIPKTDCKNLIEAINVLKGRMISVSEEWNFTKLTKFDWSRIFQSYIKSANISKMDLHNFKSKYNQLFNSLISREEGFREDLPIKRILGNRQYSLDDTKHHLKNEFEIVKEGIKNILTFEFENILTVYHAEANGGEDYYFDDDNKYYGLFINLST